MIHELTATHLRVLPDHAHTPHAERLYIGIGIGKAASVVGFVSVSLLKQHGNPAKCQIFKFSQSRASFEALLAEMRQYAPFSACLVLIEQKGHYLATASVSSCTILRSL